MPEEMFIDNTEALSWLEKADGKERDIREDPDTMLDMEASLRLVRELYAAGAPEVYVTDVEIGDDYEFAQGLKVMLPSDPTKREAIFAVGVRALREMDTPWDDVDRKGNSFKLGW